MQKGIHHCPCNSLLLTELESSDHIASGIVEPIYRYSLNAFERASLSPTLSIMLCFSTTIFPKLIISFEVAFCKSIFCICSRIISVVTGSVFAVTVKTLAFNLDSFRILFLRLAGGRYFFQPLQTCRYGASATSM